MQLTRITDGPIMEPRRDVQWEQHAVLNAAAVEADGITHLFYRGVSHIPTRNCSCIGHAWSEDGIHFERADEPILRYGQVEGEERGVEDPRITLIGDTYHLSYVAYGKHGTVISRATSKDLKIWTRQGVMLPKDQFGNNKNATLFPEKINGEYVLIHRPMGRNMASQSPYGIWVSFSDDLVTWKHHECMLHCRRGEVDWEYVKAGLGATPIKTDGGWLMVYHAVDRDHRYGLGLVLLKEDSPTTVLKRSDTPILVPEAEWELAGDVSNVVFTCGAVLKGHELWVYYGGADTVIGVAKGDIREFLSEK